MSMQNIIKKTPVSALGYGFVPDEYIPAGEDEYYLREMQDKSGIDYRRLTSYEIEVLVRNRNTSDDWNQILVSDSFNAELVKNCKFFGLVRIGKLEPVCLNFSDLKTPVGLYNSTIVSCDFGDNVVVDNVGYLSHYIIGNEVILVNVNEMVTTNHAKFGNGIIKDGEKEQVRIWMELCNENGGRRVLPFNGMLAGDAFLWSRYRDDEALMEKFISFTELKFNKKRGYYGKVGHRTVVKNCAIIKDVWIGNDAYIKGANKLKNLTINSGEEGRSQIGEGCELVNGIIGYGCRIFYGVKAVRFITAPHSQLKYGARLINSYLGSNATISCCEVLNSLIFPGHEQHHNNSFLCAAMIMGQSNMAAGATIGSNHNSRGNDGELIAGRGFWPGLCVSLKHNSKFASFTIIAKGDYPAEMHIPIPFSLVSQNESRDELTVMPAYWFLYNMYALARNSHKYNDRDKRVEKIQRLEYDYLAPDTINEIFDSLLHLSECTGRAFYAAANEGKKTKEEMIRKGKELLSGKKDLAGLEIIAPDFENSRRKTVLVKVKEAWTVFHRMIRYYGISQLFDQLRSENFASLKEWQASVPKTSARSSWINAGGQLMTGESIAALKTGIRQGTVASWDDVHMFYEKEGTAYTAQKRLHAFAALEEIGGIALNKITVVQLSDLLLEMTDTREWMVEQITASRKKDYTSPFRKMVYETEKEMEEVLGKLEENPFILGQRADLQEFHGQVKDLQATLSNWK